MPKILPILTDGHPVLRQVSCLIQQDEIKKPKIKNLIADMKVTMQKNDGIGLAAPQVGENLRLIVVNTKEGILCLINPLITKKSWRKETAEEGCLSLPGIFCQVKRSRNITCRFQDERGKTHSINAKGLLARVIQHEIDHLDGILITDKNIGEELA
ncbi:peptide deformylase [Candidatus Parcubacteria bacterium]|nr:MAG: peptide deformylase [Candidatus Parcubacteria bacterium]